MKKRERSKVAPAERVDPLETYRDLLDEESFRHLIDEIQRPLPQALRINTLKIPIQQALRTWPERYDWEVREVPFCPAGWQILSAGTRLSQTPEFKLGFYFIQDAASMLPVELFDFDGLETPLILDMAAAPGGKSTHLAARSGDRGLLIANDSSHARLPALQSALLDWGAMNAAITQLPGERLGSWFPEVFDRVLLDAPCSMETLRHESGRHRRVVSARERQGLAQRQLSMLVSAFRALKVGGELVYATCTLAPEEDEAVVDGLLKAFPGKMRVEQVGQRVGGLQGIEAPALEAARGVRFDPQVRNALRLWPHRYGTSGFFAARLAKTGPTGQDGNSRRTSSRQGNPPYRPFEKMGLNRVSRGEAAGVFARIEQAYGLDLGPVFAQQALLLWKRESAYLALPEVFLDRFADLPCHWVGFPIGEDIRDGFVPSHELVARFAGQFTRGVVTIPTGQTGTWLKGSDVDVEGIDGAPAGFIWIVRDEAGRWLGRGKILPGQGGRLKNLLPRRLAVGM